MQHFSTDMGLGDQLHTEERRGNNNIIFLPPISLVKYLGTKFSSQYWRSDKPFDLYGCWLPSDLCHRYLEIRQTHKCCSTKNPRFRVLRDKQWWRQGRWLGWNVFSFFPAHNLLDLLDENVSFPNLLDLVAPGLSKSFARVQDFLGSAVYSLALQSSITTLVGLSKPDLRAVVEQHLCYTCSMGTPHY